MRAEARSRTPPTVGTHEGAGSQWCNRLLAEAKEVAFEALRCVVGGGVAPDGGPGGAGVGRGTGPGSRQLDLRRLGAERRARRGVPRERQDAVLRAARQEGRGRTRGRAWTGNARLRVQRALLWA